MHIVDRIAALGLRFATGRFAVFPDGLGNGDLGRLAGKLPSPAETIQPIHLTWSSRAPANGFVRSTSQFTSPFASELPERARHAIVELVEPLEGAKRAIVMLQMWGDEGWSLRRKLAEHLATRGIASVLPVNPFYGRRRVYESGPPIRTVEEFLCMGLGAITEVRSLLERLRQDYVVGLGGFSMGSGFAVGASTTLPFPVALTLMGAAPSPAKAFTEGVLKLGLPRSLRREKRALLATALDSVSALSRQPLEHHRRAVLLAARGDGFVPVEDAIMLADHWRGAELRLVSGGHVTLWFRRTAEKIAAIERSFERHCALLDQAGG